VTQARSSAIRRRDERGVNKMPYMLAVPADRLGLRDTPREGAQGSEETYPKVPVPVVAMADVGRGVIAPPARLPADAGIAALSADGHLATQRVFWARMAAETGIGDLRAIVRLRASPRYDDLARSVGYVRERRGETRGQGGGR